jgi:hypothetical protein
MASHAHFARLGQQFAYGKLACDAFSFHRDSVMMLPPEHAPGQGARFGVSRAWQSICAASVKIKLFVRRH